MLLPLLLLLLLQPAPIPPFSLLRRLPQLESQVEGLRDRQGSGLSLREKPLVK